MKEFISKIFGKLELDENEVFEFPCGILGFPEQKRFFFLKVLNNNLPFPIEVMHSFDSDNLAFIVVDPFYIIPNFSVLASPDDVKEIDLKDISEVVMRVILRFEGKRIFSNLLAPIVLNTRARKGKQIVLEGPEELLDAEVCIDEDREKDIVNEKESETKEGENGMGKESEKGGEGKRVGSIGESVGGSEERDFTEHRTTVSLK